MFTTALARILAQLMATDVVNSDTGKATVTEMIDTQAHKEMMGLDGYERENDTASQSGESGLSEGTRCIG